MKSSEARDYLEESADGVTETLVLLGFLVLAVVVVALEEVAYFFRRGE